MTGLATRFPGISSVHRVADQQVPLTRVPIADGLVHRRPVVAAIVNEKAFMAVLDTGATTTAILFEGDDIVDLWETRRPIPGLAESSAWLASLVEVESFRLGDTLLAPAQLLHLDQSHSLPQTQGIVGMDFLLRHRAVCFDWESGTLLLGQLGPCAGGAVADEATLGGSLGIELTVQTRSGEAVPGLVDTGADYTYCSSDEGTSGHGWEFSFGLHAALRSGCRYDPISRPLVIGMKTLSQFRAFGWQLSPLRVFFVPKGEA